MGDGEFWRNVLGLYWWDFALVVIDFSTSIYFRVYVSWSLGCIAIYARVELNGNPQPGHGIG